MAKDKEPGNWATEQAAIGAVLLASSTLLPELADTLRPEHFHRPAHKYLWSILLDLWNEGTPPDLIIVLDEIERRGREWVEKVGGIAYVSALPQACASVDNGALYAGRVRDDAARRALRTHLTRLQERIENGASAADLAPDLERFGIDAGGGADLGWTSPGSDWLRTEPPPRDYLIRDRPGDTDYDGQGPGILPRGIAGLLAAAGGTGKTYALTGLALALVTGRPWLGGYVDGREVAGFPVDPAVRGRVALVLGEESAAEVRRRLHTQARLMGLDPDRDGRAVSERLAVLPGAGRSLALVDVDPLTRTVRPTATAVELRAWLRREAGPRGWDAVIFDPLARLFLADTETDNGAATRLIETLETFANQLPGTPAVLAAHHTRKPGTDGEPTWARPTAAAVRGSSGLVDGARWVAGMIRVPERLVAFDLVKTNYGPGLRAAGKFGILLATGPDGGIRVASDAEERAAMAAAPLEKPGKSPTAKEPPPKRSSSVVGRNNDG